MVIETFFSEKYGFSKISNKIKILKALSEQKIKLKNQKNRKFRKICENVKFLNFFFSILSTIKGTKADMNRCEKITNI